MQSDFGFNQYFYGARFYNAALGQFHTQDRFAEKYSEWSPYHYANNNPILNIDVNGDSVEINQGGGDLGSTIRQNLISAQITMNEFASDIGQVAQSIGQKISNFFDGGEALRYGGDGINLTTKNDLVPGNEDELKGKTNEGIRDVNVDEFTPLSSTPSTAFNGTPILSANKIFNKIDAALHALDVVVTAASKVVFHTICSLKYKV